MKLSFTVSRHLVSALYCILRHSLCARRCKIVEMFVCRVVDTVEEADIVCSDEQVLNQV